MSKRSIELLDPKTSMVTEDWANRETVITIVDRIQKIVTILDKFGKMGRYSITTSNDNKKRLLPSKTEQNIKTKLKMQSEKLEFMEKQVEYLESLFDLEKKNEG